ncbi:MAG: hypothetical protein CSA38_01260, partial [Flavobacteriales bacterium]
MNRNYKKHSFLKLVSLSLPLLFFLFGRTVYGQSCPEQIPAGAPTVALNSSQVTMDVDNNSGTNPGYVNAITIVGEPNPFTYLHLPDGASYSVQNYNNPQDPANVYVTKDGQVVKNITDPDFTDALIAANSTRDLDHYMGWDDNVVNGDYVNFTYSTPIKSAGNRYVVATERWGNNPYKVSALDQNGNIIGTTRDIIPKGHPNTNYIGTGFNTGSYDQEVFYAVYPLTALVPPGTEIYGIRLTQNSGAYGSTADDGGDGKIFILADPFTLEQAPSVDIGQGGISITHPTCENNTGSISFSAYGTTGYAIETSINGASGSFSALNNPVTYSNLAPGVHTLRLRYVDYPDCFTDYTITINSPTGCYNLSLNPDSGSGVEGTPFTVPNILANDTLDGNTPAIGTNPGEVYVSKSGTWPAGITLDSATGEVNIAGTVVAGTYTLDYRVCVIGLCLDCPPALCKTETVTIIVMPPLTDSDGDGVPDIDDLDDDNDGILDAHENHCVFGFYDDFGTGTEEIETPYINSSHYTFNEDTIYDGEYTIATSPRPGAVQNDWDSWNTFTDHTGNTNGRMLIVNAEYGSGEFYRRTISGFIPNRPVNFKFYVRNVISPDMPEPAKPNITYSVEDSSGNVVFTADTGDILETAGWVELSGSIVSAETELTLVLRNNVNNNTQLTGNDLAIDDIYFDQPKDCDTDGDGIPDHLDLDSDNDGCLDAIEGGGNFTYNHVVNAGGTVTVGTGSTAENKNLGNTVDANGVPTVAGAAGQGVGTSQDAAQQADECDPCNAGSTLFTDVDGDGVGDKCD